MPVKTIIVGNWKMNKTATEAVQFIHKLAPLVASSAPQVLLAVPYTAIFQADQAAKKTHIRIGAQNVHDLEEGAFTGEISSEMLKDAGAEFVIIGHSERRHIFNESDEFIHKKIVRALMADLMTILCVGETEVEHKEAKTKEVLERQLTSALKDLPKNTSNLVVAYEPVWAIGTGKSATSDLANDMHLFCRNCLIKYFGKKQANQIPILYGGSVKPSNIAEFMKQEHINGVLVGGASLDPKNFAKIVNY